MALAATGCDGRLCERPITVHKLRRALSYTQAGLCLERISGQRQLNLEIRCDFCLASAGHLSQRPRQAGLDGLLLLPSRAGLRHALVV